MLGQGPSVCAGVCLCVIAACAGGAVAAEGKHWLREFSGSEILRTLGYYPKDGGAAAKLVESLGFGVVRLEESVFAKRQFWAVQVCDAQDQGARRTSVSPVAHTMMFEVFAKATDGGDVTVTATLDGGSVSSNVSAKPLRWFLKLGRSAAFTNSFDFAGNTTEYTLGEGLTVRDQRFVCEDAHAAWLRRLGNMTYDCENGHTVVLEYPAGCPRKGEFGRRDSTCSPRMSLTGPRPLSSFSAERRAADAFLRFGRWTTVEAIGYTIDFPDLPAFEVPIRQMHRGSLITKTDEGGQPVAPLACVSRAHGEFQTRNRTNAMSRLLDSIEKKTFRCKFSTWKASTYAYVSSPMPQESRSFAVHFARSRPLDITVNQQRVQVWSTDNFSTPELILWWAPQGQDAVYVFSARLEQLDRGEAVTVRMEGKAGGRIGSSTRFYYSGTSMYNIGYGPQATSYNEATDMFPREFCAPHGAPPSGWSGGCLNTAVCEQVLQVHVIAPDQPESDPANLDTGDRVIADAQAGAAGMPEAACRPNCWRCPMVSLCT